MKYLIPFLLSIQLLLAATSLSVTYDSVTKQVAPSNLTFIAPLTATAPTTGNSVVNKTALDAAIVAGVASKLNTTNGAATGLTFAGTAAYNLSDESSLVLGVDYGMALDVGLTSTSVRARVRSVPNIATLTNSVSPLTSDLFSAFTVLGAQGGTFRVALTNGITFDGGLYFPSVVDPSKCFARVWDNTTANAAWWGAVPDDGLDDTAAFQALSDFISPDGFPSTAPPGEYLISSVAWSTSC